MGERLRSFALLSYLGFLMACQPAYQRTALRSWDYLETKQYEEALALYEDNVTRSRDQLLRWLDEGILLREQGRYEESNQRFLRAARFFEEFDYVSISEEGLVLATDPRQSVYRGENFEKVLVHVYLALNFVRLEDWEAALVEVRKVNHILHRMISEYDRPYELNPFARYMSALLYESEEEWNDAWIAYQHSLEMEPKLLERFPVIKKDLMRMAKVMGFSNEWDRLVEEHGRDLAQEARETLEQMKGAVVLIFESGKSPRKRSKKERHVSTDRAGVEAALTLPITYYERRPSRIQKAILQVKVEDSNWRSAETAVLYDIEKTAIAQLKDRMNQKVLQALAGAGVKIGIAAGVGALTESEDLGFLTALLLFAMSDADTRSWLLLPAHLQVAKLFLNPGKYQARILYQDANGNTLEEERALELEVKARKKLFLQRRALY